jgi:hypothetical protein
MIRHGQIDLVLPEEQRDSQIRDNHFLDSPTTWSYLSTIIGSHPNQPPVGGWVKCIAKSLNYRLAYVYSEDRL